MIHFNVDEPISICVLILHNDFLSVIFVIFIESRIVFVHGEVSPCTSIIYGTFIIIF